MILCKGSLDVLDGTLLEPTLAGDSSNAAEVSDWKAHSQHIAGVILSTISAGPKIHVSSKTNGPQMWKQLKAAYELTTSAASGK
ncbi:hypothetical protein FRC18_000683 [Serendipita sp. 400]|nr:hypothetical protein FRC18_000683 [Serendipita sp. 400]